ncbi:MAG: NADH-quinone oxidoreductase subunit M [Bacteroidia bacterium]|nr:NADH-quinone oxidoreductase subunit M [Bacteroidia bacterium]
MPHLSILIWLPLVALLVMAFGPRKGKELYRWSALVVSLLQLIWVLVAALPQYLTEQAEGGKYFLQEKFNWIGFSLGDLGRVQIDYFLAVDGLGMSLILLTTIIMPIAVISSWKLGHNVKGYFMLFMLLDLCMIGVFCALDFFLFYLFYEFMLLPMFFLIGLWGGPRREYASLKFFIYTLVGSVFMLLIMIGLLFSFTDPELNTDELRVYTLNMTHMMASSGGELLNVVDGSIFDLGSTLLGVNARLLAFVVLFVGFAIKLPMIPVHTWLPDAHVEAPTPISVLLAGILLKVGGYGMLRICFGIFPDGAIHFQWYVGLMGVISIIYGAMVAMAQKDLKRLVAYSSISHMGFHMLGISSLTVVGMTGAVYQLFTHGIISAMLFLVVGVIYDRVHDRTIENFRGLWNLMPRFAFFTLIGFFASLGMPGFAAFVSELLVFMGAFQSAIEGGLPLWMPAVGTLGIILGAVYYLRTFRQMFFGKFDPHNTSSWKEKLTDLNLREYVMLLPLAALIVLLGVWPSLILDLFEGSMGAYAAELVEKGRELLNH